MSLKSESALKTSETLNIVLDDTTLSFENISLLDFLVHNTPSQWVEFFSMEEVQKELKLISAHLSEQAEKGKTIYPDIVNVFRIFYYLSLKDIKAVIFGQDPYHNGSAVGTAFTVLKGNKINPSLKNMFTEVKNCGFKVKDPTCGDLTPWIKQGVFLYNTSLTVEESIAGSHLKLWSKFTQLFINYISSKRKDIVFLLLGEKAQLYKKYISHNLFVETSHPSPFSADRGFLGSKCFNKVNELLKLKEKIDWSL